MKHLIVACGLTLGAWGLETVAGTFPYVEPLTERYSLGEVEVSSFDEPKTATGSKMQAVEHVAVIETAVVEFFASDESAWESDAAAIPPAQAALAMKRVGAEFHWMGYTGDGWVDLSGKTATEDAWGTRIEIDYSVSPHLVRYSVKQPDEAIYTVLKNEGREWLSLGGSATRLADVKLYGYGKVAGLMGCCGTRPIEAKVSASENHDMNYAHLKVGASVSEVWGAEAVDIILKDADGQQVAKRSAPVSSGQIVADFSDVAVPGGVYSYSVVLSGIGQEVEAKGKTDVELFSNIDWFGFAEGAFAKASASGISIDSTTRRFKPSGTSSGVVKPTVGSTVESETSVEATIYVDGVWQWKDLPLGISPQFSLVLARTSSETSLGERTWAYKTGDGDWTAVAADGVPTENGTYRIKLSFDYRSGQKKATCRIKASDAADYVTLVADVPLRKPRLVDFAVRDGEVAFLNASYRTVKPTPPIVSGTEIALSSDADINLAKLSAGETYSLTGVEGARYCWRDDPSGAGKWAKIEGGQLKTVAGRPENGIESYASHILGLDPADADSKPYLASVQNADSRCLSLTLPKVSQLNPVDTGVEVKYSLLAADDPTFQVGAETVAESDEPNFAVDLTSMKDSVQYYRADIRLSYDPSDPVAPAIDDQIAENVFTGVRRISTPETGGHAVRIEGNLLYFGAGHSLYVFDVTTPAEPELLGSCSGLGKVRQLAVENGMVYITARETGMWIVDATDPSRPKVVTRYDAVELATGVDVRNGLVMLAQRQNGVEFIDVRDPAHPQHIRIEKTNESQSTLYWKGVCYSGEWGGGLLTAISATDMSQVATRKTLNVHGYGDGIDAHGDRLYISTGHHYRHLEDGKWVADTSDSSAGYGLGHAVEIVDISDPAAPRLLGRCVFDRFHRSGMDMWSPRVSGEGRYVFCADTYNGLYAVDALDPEHPTVVGHVTVPYADGSDTALSHPVTSVEVGEGVVYLTVSDVGLLVADCPAAHRHVGEGDAAVLPGNLDYRYPYDKTYTNLAQVWKPSVQGQVRSVAALNSTHLYVAAGHAGLSVLDSDYNELKRIDVPFCGDVKVRGNRLYSAEGRNGLAVYDLANPANPTLLRRDTSFNTEIDAGCVIWLMAPSGVNDLVLSTHGANGYGFYRDGNTLSGRYKRLNTITGWDKVMSDEIINNRFAVNERGKLSWVDIANPDGSTSTGLPVSGSFSGTLNTGVCAYKDSRFLFAGSSAFYYLAPEATSLASATSGSLPSGVAGGQVVWNGATAVGMTERINKRVSLIDLTTETRPALTFVEKVEGCPDRSIFFNGKLVVPCGYAGVLRQK